MCGIAGYVGTRALPDERLLGALAALRRRGPDASGRARFEMPGGRIAHLLATRLDIIDPLPRADQPLRLGSRTIAYNGELYNYLELGARLERRLATESDTEVMVATLERGGIEALDACEGMWAFALYDEAAARLTLARDRFGEKPLYLHRDDTGLYFASEPKAIFALLGRTLPVDFDQVYRYLVNGYKALYKGGATFFRGLEELGAGTALEIDADGRERLHCYWRAEPRPNEEMGYEEAVAGTRERLVRAVELRLRADVPLAFAMSGGVDSTGLISIAKNLCGYDVHGFTVLNEDERYDERDAVFRSVEELDIRHTAIPLETRDFLSRLRRLVRYHDAPVYTITYYAHWLLMRAVADGGYRVCVSGTGADELFTGYYDHHLAYLYEVREEPALHAASLTGWEREVRPLVRNPHLGDPSLFVGDPGFRDHIFLDADRFAGFLERPWHEPFAEERYVDGLLRNRMLNELFHEVVPPILHEDDANAMYWSVENRSPYLDRELFDFAYAIPARHLVRDGFAKAVLRDALRGVAPDHVLDTPRKVGFNAPVRAFLDTGDASVRGELLADSPLWDHVRRERVEELLDDTELPNSASKFLFYVVNAKLFLEEFAA